MHELSIAHAVVESAVAAALADGGPDARVTTVRLRIGVLSGVVRSALAFAFDVAAAGTAAENAVLQITDVPVSVFCPTCSVDVLLPSPHRFRCPACDTPTPQLLAGRELELTSIELVFPAGTPEPTVQSAADATAVPA